MYPENIFERMSFYTEHYRTSNLKAFVSNNVAMVRKDIMRRLGKVHVIRRIKPEYEGVRL
jgi:hypothetical protein